VGDVMIYSDLVELLDRKYNFLMKSKKESFMIDFSDFIFFLMENDLIKEYSMKLINDFMIKKEKYVETLKNEMEEFKKISKTIRKKYPELDDSKKEFENKEMNRDYIYSFAFFDEVLSDDYRDRGVPMYPEILDDNTKPRKLLDVIIHKISEYENDENHEHARDFDKKLHEKIIKLKDLHEYNFKEWINYKRSSGGNTLIEAINIIEKINPIPENTNESDAEWFMRRFKDHHFFGWIQDLTYGVITQYSNYRPANLTGEQINSQIDDLKTLITRIYENIRQNIGLKSFINQVLNRYKTRCVCYDNVRDLVIKNNKFIRNREEKLTIHFAKFLFDNGISTNYKLKRGQHEIDIFNPNSKNPIAIEVKVYKDSKSKKYLIDGLYQLHAYLNNLSSQWNINDGYFIIFRLGGPIYEFPDKIQINKFTLNIILIDVGESSESGSKQPKPIIIKEKEIIKNLKKK
jgi:hypothetical protein